MKKQTKLLAVLISLAICSFSSIVLAAETVVITGSFSPTGTISITCNNTSPAFGTIALGSNSFIANINVTNNGNVSCSVTAIAGNGTATWSLVSANFSTVGPNQFAVAVFNGSATWLNIFTSQTLSANLSQSEGKLFGMKVYISNTTSSASASQAFYCNLTAAALS
jgi:hypothetical protein